jgi:molybdenum cofactor cytidylyltransferase
VKAHQFPAERRAGVILAAGASARMGRDKALLPFGRETLLSAAIRSLRPFTEVVLVITGENAESLKPIVIAESAEMVINPQANKGQFSSLRAGLRAVLERRIESSIVTHVDRPPASSTTLNTLLAAFKAASSRPIDTRAWTIVPDVNGVHGHPIIVGREMMNAFLAADADQTARDVEHSLPGRVEYVSVQDENVIRNVNTPEDYRVLLDSLAP